MGSPNLPRSSVRLHPSCAGLTCGLWRAVAGRAARSGNFHDKTRHDLHQAVGGRRWSHLFVCRPPAVPGRSAGLASGWLVSPPPPPPLEHPHRVDCTPAMSRADCVYTDARRSPVLHGPCSLPAGRVHYQATGLDFRFICLPLQTHFLELPVNQTKFQPTRSCLTRLV